jgi:hypothetical protein
VLFQDKELLIATLNNGFTPDGDLPNTGLFFTNRALYKHSVTRNGEDITYQHRKNWRLDTITGYTVNSQKSSVKRVLEIILSLIGLIIMVADLAARRPMGLN